MAGACGASNRLKIFRSAPHYGEEPPISGQKGSGAVFFSHCPLHCLYCQNYPWSQEGAGTESDVSDLEARLLALHEAGCHNWNLVSPTPWLPWIAAALRQLKNRGISLPVVYNSSGFENTEVLEEFAASLDIAIVDLRYADDATARAASGVERYVESARRAATWFHRRLGRLRIDADGIARRGTIFRLLVLPGHAGEAAETLRWLARNLGPETTLSVMAQYQPAYRASGMPPFHRGITREEYDRTLEVMEDCGFENGWVQEFGTAVAPELTGWRMEPDSGPPPPCAGGGGNADTPGLLLHNENENQEKHR